MKRLFVLLLTAAMLLTLAACGTQNTDSGAVDEPKNDAAADITAPAPADDTPEGTGSRILVVYFSATGHTKTVAEYLQAALDADLYEIVPQEPYTAADLDYSTDGCRANLEQNDDSARPVISGSVDNMAGYDVVLIGYPIWWGKAPKIVDTFLESYDFSGKTIVPFCTSGGSGIDGSLDEIQALAPDAEWLTGQRFASTAGAADVQSWVDGLGLSDPAI